MKIYIKICKFLTRISPVLNTKFMYFCHFHKPCNLKKPKTLEEKLCWLKLYDYAKNPLVIKCADKYSVREYIKNVGCENLLNTIIDVYDKPEDINWDVLPQKFVLKWNFGATYNIICKDKSKLDIDQTISKLKKWGNEKYWLYYSEMQYKYAPKKIICETYLEDEYYKNSLPDYKVYCFHGEPLAFLVMHDRDKILKREFFDLEWNPLPSPFGCISPKESTKKPQCLEEMITAARKLSKGFPFVRCDFYAVNNKVYFGEMTFTPAGGIYLKHTTVNGKQMTEYLNVD